MHILSHLVLHRHNRPISYYWLQCFVFFKITRSELLDCLAKSFIFFWRPSFPSECTFQSCNWLRISQNKILGQNAIQYHLFKKPTLTNGSWKYQELRTWVPVTYFGHLCTLIKLPFQELSIIEKALTLTNYNNIIILI